MSGLEILKWLETSKLVESFEVIEFRQDYSIFYLKLSVDFIDGSLLHTKEYIDEKDRNYSYHWQDKDGKLIIRWDNAPYHRNIATFPHHLHLNEQGNIKESFTITIKEALEYIEKYFKKSE